MIFYSQLVPAEFLLIFQHPFLPNSNIVFQFKAAEIGDKSWFEKEILTSDKSDLKPKLK